MKKHFLFAGLFAALIISAFWLSQCTGNPVVVVAPPVVVVDSTENHFCKTIQGAEYEVQHAMPDQAVGAKTKYWPNGSTLRVQFLSQNIARIALFKQAALDWSAVANLFFTYPAVGPYDIRVAFADNNGSWSYVATDAKMVAQGQPTMNCGWTSYDMFAHEIGHAVGFFHEQSNYNNPLCFNHAVVDAELKGSPNFWDQATIDFNVYRLADKATTEATPRDSESIMQYFFPGTWMCNLIPVFGGKVLSLVDKEFAARIYPKAIPPPPPPPGNNITLTFTQRNEIMRLLNKSKAATDAAKVASDSARLSIKKVVGF